MMAGIPTSEGRSPVSKRWLHLVAALLCAALFTAVYPAAAEPTADAQFARAKAQAKQHHKGVLVLFTASWCVGCKEYEHFFADPAMKAITDKAFVLLPIDIGEEVMMGHTRPSTPGAMPFRSEFGISGALELPFLVMTDADGKQIVNSELNGKKGADIGYPATAEDIDWYVEMLRRAAPQLSAQDLTATQKWLDDHSPFAPYVRTKLKK